jgi:hypothetical protein
MLANYMAIWCILWLLGIVHCHLVCIGHLVYFSRFGILYQEKSGNPGYHMQPEAETHASISPSIFATIFCRNVSDPERPDSADLDNLIQFGGTESPLRNRDRNQGCQIFLGPNIPKWKKYTQWPQILPNGQKLYQMAIKYS